MNYRKYVFDEVNYLQAKLKKIEELIDDELAPIIETRIDKLKTYYKIKTEKRLRKILITDTLLTIWFRVYINRPGDMLPSLLELFSNGTLMYEDYVDDE